MIKVFYEIVNGKKKLTEEAIDYVTELFIKHGEGTLLIEEEQAVVDKINKDMEEQLCETCGEEQKYADKNVCEKCNFSKQDTYMRNID